GTRSVESHLACIETDSGDHQKKNNRGDHEIEEHHELVARLAGALWRWRRAQLGTKRLTRRPGQNGPPRLLRRSAQLTRIPAHRLLILLRRLRPSKTQTAAQSRQGLAGPWVSCDQPS